MQVRTSLEELTVEILELLAVDVRHRGDPPQLFKEGIPVVLEGRFASATPSDDRFLSDRIMVKHSEVYRAKHPDRVKGSVDNP